MFEVLKEYLNYCKRTGSEATGTGYEFLLKTKKMFGVLIKDDFVLATSFGNREGTAF